MPTWEIPWTSRSCKTISVNGTLVIPKGGFAFGTVTEAQPKRRMARGGKLEINVDYVKLAIEQRQSSLAFGERAAAEGATPAR